MAIQKRASHLGDFMRKRRDELSLSQRALGLLFSPPVTTQFISNIERGVTPLPPIHVSTLSKALQTPETEIVAALEKEYALRLHNRLGHAPQAEIAGASPSETQQVQALWEAYNHAEPHAKRAFEQACESILHIALRKPQS